MKVQCRKRISNASSQFSWIKYTKRQPCAPMYGRLYHYAGNNPVRYTDPTGLYTDEEIFKFWLMPADDQIVFLKSEINSVSNGLLSEKGAKAAEMRELRNVMDLFGLFQIDEDFMNTSLRDFLNTKEDGTEYTREDLMKAGWKELSSLKSQYHQTNTNGVLNAKFVNVDGREVVMDSNWNVVKNDLDKGTYNYADPEFNLNGIRHWLYDVRPYEKQYKGQYILRMNSPSDRTNSSFWK